MLLSSLLLALLSPVLALPTPPYRYDPRSALSYGVSETRNMQFDRIARLAHAVDDAPCPDRLSSAELVAQSVDEDQDVTWQITRQPGSDTYTLAFASPTPEDLLELLASVSPDPEAGSHLLPLPAPLLRGFPGDAPMIYSAFTPYLNTVAEAADAVSQLLEPRPTISRWLSSVASVFGFPVHTAPAAVPRLEVAGQGLGAVMALLVAIRVSAENPILSVRGTMFSMPKVGDASFADYVDRLTSTSSLRLERISSTLDPVPSLPPPHYGLQHPPSIIERHLFSESSAVGRARVEDAYGPYEGVMIGLSC